MRTPRSAFFLLATLLLGSCATSTRDYIDQALGSDVTRGRVVKIEGLYADGVEHLGDGVVFKLSEHACRITLQAGQSTQQRMVHPGSELLLGRDGDYILKPAGVEPVPPAEAETGAAPPAGGAEPPPERR